MTNPDEQQQEPTLAPRSGVSFPRLELPLPPFASPLPTPAPAAPVAPATDLDDRPVGGHDQATTEWQYPFPAPQVQQGYTYQVVPPPLPVSAPATHPAPVPVPARVPAPAPAVGIAQAMPLTPSPAALEATATANAYVPPAIDAASAPSSEPSTSGNIRPSMVALVVLAVFAIALVWASKMAFAAGLLAFAALLASELAVATSLMRRPSESRPPIATILAVVAGIGALLAAKGALAQFGEMAFVAGLFVLVSVVPTLLALGVVALVLRRRRDPSPADQALRAGTLIRIVPLLALLAAGYQAHKTFSAVPDAIVALGIVALVAFNVMSVLRGTGRAALATAAR